MNNEKERNRIVEEFAIAYLMLAQRGSFTVKALCTKAGRSRATYYRYFKSPEEILSKCLKVFNREFNESFVNDRLNRLDYLYTCFEAVYKHRNLMSLLRKQGKDELILRLMNFNGDSSRRSVENDFYVGAIYNVIVKWIDRGYREKSGDLARRCMALLNTEAFQKNVGRYFSGCP